MGGLPGEAIPTREAGEGPGMEGDPGHGFLVPGDGIVSPAWNGDGGPARSKPAVSQQDSLKDIHSKLLSIQAQSISYHNLQLPLPWCNEEEKNN